MPDRLRDSVASELPSDGDARTAFIVQASGVGVWEYTFADQQMTWSDAMFGMWGRTRVEGVPTITEWRNLVHPEDTDRAVWSREQIIAAGGKFEAEVRVVQRDGTLRHLLTRATIKSDPAGEPIGYVGVNIDLTDQRRTEERFRGVFDSDLMGFTIFDSRTGETAAINDTFLRMTGHSRADFDEGRWDWRDFTVPEFLHLDEEAIAQTRERGWWDAYEKEYLRKDGSCFPARLSSAPLPGEPGRVIVSVEDITASRAAEAELRARARQLSAYIEQATAGFAEVNADGIFTLVNDRFCEITGRSREELLTLSLLDITHPEDAVGNRPKFERAVREGTPYTHEKRYIRPDGSIVWVNNSVSVIRRENGELHGVLAVCIDVTDRRLAEEAVRENEARLRAVTDNLPGGIVYQVGTGQDGTTREFKFLSPSFEKLTGYPLAAVKTDPLLPYNIILPDDLPALAAAEQEAIRAHRPFDHEARFRRADGEIRWARIISAPRRQADGSTIWDGIQIDVTDQKILETRLHALNEGLEQRVRERTAELERVHEQLRESQKLEAIGQLTGGVAHDFNNLLTPILGSLDLLVQRSELAPRDERLLRAALESAERARTLVQRLLAFARRQPLQPGPVDVAATITGMVDLIASTSGPRVTVLTDVADGLSAALAEQNQLEMALLNLCVNARDAMSEGGTLCIAARDVAVLDGAVEALAGGNYVMLSVSDTGEGMSEEVARKAIEPFFSTKGIGRGTGLGLSMVHGLALQLGGGMAIKSKPGLGTTIELYLPLAVASAERNDGQARLHQAAAADTSVLLVDDDVAARGSTAEMLADLGYTVREAASAAEALRLLEEWQPELMITDHLMPGMTGTELTETVRTRFPALRMLIVSGYADLDSLPADLPRLSKPFRQHELGQALAGLSRGEPRGPLVVQQEQ